MFHVEHRPNRGPCISRCSPITRLMKDHPSNYSHDGIVDLAIIGAGPTGLFAAFYAGLRHMSVLLLDSLDSLGGQLATLYPEKYIYDVAGFPRVLAKDLAKSLSEQALQFRPIVRLGEQVLTLDRPELQQFFSIRTKKG